MDMTEYELDARRIRALRRARQLSLLDIKRRTGIDLRVWVPKTSADVEAALTRLEALANYHVLEGEGEEGAAT